MGSSFLPCFMLISFSTVRIKILLFITLFTPLWSSALPLSADVFGILCGKLCFVIYSALTPLGGWCPQSLSRRSAAPPHSERSEGGVEPAPVEGHSKKDDWDSCFKLSKGSKDWLTRLNNSSQSLNPHFPWADRNPAPTRSIIGDVINTLAANPGLMGFLPNLKPKRHPHCG